MNLSKLNVLLVLLKLLSTTESFPVNCTGELTSSNIRYEAGNESNDNGGQLPIYNEYNKDNTRRQNLMARDSVEIVLGADDFANAARYAKTKIPEKAGEWKKSLKEKIVNRLADDKSDSISGADADILNLLDKGVIKIVDKMENDQEEPIKKEKSRQSQRANVKSNIKDLGVKDFEYKKPDNNDYDAFESS